MLKQKLKKDIKELLEIKHKTGSITETAKVYCAIHNIQYSDSIRRTVSKVLRHTKSHKKHSPAKILIFDIETAPLKSFIWSIWQNNIGLHMLQSDWFMLSWSAKWLFEEEVVSEVLTREEVLTEDDERITKGLYKLFEEADIVIAHNGKKFDIKRVNTRFLKHGLTPPSPYILIDTLLTLRSKFSLTSNKLDWVASEFFGYEGKIKTDFSLWERCSRGDKEALEEMKKYNEQDVLILEEVYLRIRPWIQPHPNVSLFIDTDKHACPSCGSENLSDAGTYCTYANEYDAHRCNDCGAISRKRSSNIPVNRKKTMLYSTPT